MKIGAEIDYWGEGFLTFEPEKILGHLNRSFPQVTIDPKDYSWDELERFIERVQQNIEEPNRSRIIESMKGKNRTNGPVFRFNILTTNGNAINGFVNRHRVEFYSESFINGETEKLIIDFLKSLNYGRIISDTNTSNFSKTSNQNSDCWLLE